MANTARLNLPQPVGTDLISLGDNAIKDGFAILDSATIYGEGTFAARPAAAALEGKVYVATDVGIVYLSDGTNWIELSRGGGTIPIGGMIDYAGSGDPADTRFLLADGRAISRATYAAAFALMGTTYGVGNGTTTFNIPDCRGRGTVGPDNMGTAQGAAGRMTANNTRGASGGQEKSTIATANLPAHTHAVGTLDMSILGDHVHDIGTVEIASGGAHTHGTGTLAVAGSGTLTSGNASANHTHASLANVQFLMTSTGGSLWDTAADYISGGRVDIYQASNFTITAPSGSAHTHTIASHTHTLSGSTASGGSHTHTLSGSVAVSGSHKHILSGGTASTGGAAALNTMNPYTVVNKIVRVS
jgi:microcystin-dependent protein